MSDAWADNFGGTVQRDLPPLDATPRAMGAMKLHRVYGPPGTGKTTYLAAQVQRAIDKYGSYGVVVASLTRAAAAEVAGRGTKLPDSHIGTLHSHAYHALGRPAIAETSAGLKQWNEYVNLPSMRISARHAVDPENALPEQCVLDTDGATLLNEINIYRQRMIPDDAWPDPHKRFWNKWLEFKGEHGYNDFTDLIERALYETDEMMQKPRVLMIDEAQDMSKLEFALAMRWGSSCQQVVIVGDQDQNLYQWRGSDPEAFITDRADTVRVLSQSYRIPEAVHNVAVQWIEQIASREPVAYEPRRDADGRVVPGVLRREPHTYRDPVTLMHAIQRDIDRGKTVMVLGSCGYMVNPLIGELKAHGVPFWNPYRVKHGGWNPLRGAGRLLAFVKPRSIPEGGEMAKWTWGDVQKWAAPMQAKGVMKHGAKTLLESRTTKDRFNTSRADDEASFAAVMELFLPGDEHEHHMGIAGVDYEWWARHLRLDEAKRNAYALAIARKRGFRALRETPKLVVGTIHSVKGGQADVVYLFPDLSGAAYFEGWRPGGDTRSAIVRQMYVGMTRAREELVLCAPSGPEAIRWPA